MVPAGHVFREQSVIVSVHLTSAGAGAPSAIHQPLLKLLQIPTRQLPKTPSMLACLSHRKKLLYNLTEGTDRSILTASSLRFLELRKAMPGLASEAVQTR